VWPSPAQPYYPELANIRFYADAADAFNSETRTCEKCRAVQPRFPTELVGWRRYAQYTELANRARQDMTAAWTAKK
jgi:methylphosphotriester-DNA--protein-cysteine methyltransferase